MFGFFSKTIQETNKFEKALENTKKNDEVKVIGKEEKELLPDGFAWIEGYKAVRHDMKSFYGDVEYQFGIISSLRENEEIFPCKKGFHFCLTLENIISLCPPEQGVRYFKVKALTPVSYKFNEEGDVICAPKSAKVILNKCLKPSVSQLYSYDSYLFDNTLDIKYVGREIEFIEEVPFDDYKGFIRFSFFKDEKSYRSVHNLKDLYKFLNNKWIEACKNVGLTESFATIYFKKNITKEKFNNFCHSYEKSKQNLEMFFNENLNFDIKLFMFLEEEKNKDG